MPASPLWNSIGEGTLGDDDMNCAQMSFRVGLSVLWMIDNLSSLYPDACPPSTGIELLSLWARANWSGSKGKDLFALSLLTLLSRLSPQPVEADGCPPWVCFHWRFHWVQSSNSSHTNSDVVTAANSLLPCDWHPGVFRPRYPWRWWHLIAENYIYLP